jgi:hypothetical protein
LRLTLSSVRARRPATTGSDRIEVVQEVYESALIMAHGYKHELLKSEAEVMEELEQALGETLRCRHTNSPSEVREARPAA